MKRENLIFWELLLLIREWKKKNFRNKNVKNKFETFQKFRDFLKFRFQSILLFLLILLLNSKSINFKIISKLRFVITT